MVMMWPAITASLAPPSTILSNKGLLHSSCPKETSNCSQWDTVRWGWWGAAGCRQGGGVTNHVPQCHQSLGNDSLGVCLVFQHLSNATREIGGEDSF